MPKPDFTRQVIDAAERGSSLNPAPTDLASVIQPATAFMVAGLMHDQWGQVTPQFRSRVVTYVLDERFYCTNPGASLPDKIEIDLGDGRGYRTVRFGSRITTTYASGGSATAAVRCTYGTTVLEGRLTVPILEENAGTPDETWPLTGIPSLTQGTAYVYRAPGHAIVVNPVIIAEGFPGGYPVRLSTTS